MRMPFWIVFAGVVLALGCGGSESGKYAAVSGQVILNGSPLADATVSFQPDSTIGRGSSGKTDAQGKYSLTVLGTGEREQWSANIRSSSPLLRALRPTRRMTTPSPARIGFPPNTTPTAR